MVVLAGYTCVIIQQYIEISIKIKIKYTPSTHKRWALPRELKWGTFLAFLYTEAFHSITNTHGKQMTSYRNL